MGDVPFAVLGGGVEVVEGEVETERQSTTILHIVEYPSPHQHVVREHGDDLWATADDFVGFIFDEGLDEGGVVEPSTELSGVKDRVLAGGTEVDFVNEQVDPRLHGFGALDEIFVLVADGDGLGDGVNEVDHLSVDGVDGDGTERDLDIAGVLDGGIPKWRPRHGVVLANQFTPECFERGAGSLRVHEFSGQPRIEFLALLVGNFEFFELRVEDRFTHQLALCVRR